VSLRPQKNLIILVTDDDADIREALSDLLEDLGHSIATAAHGREALDHVAAGNWPCAILLDWLMPTMGGREFLEERERSPALRDIPVFVISGTHVPSGDHRVAGWLTKPFDAQAVVALLASVCSRHCRRARCSFDDVDAVPDADGGPGPPRHR
jgi:CheY-like chemotaxis protein